MKTSILNKFFLVLTLSAVLLGVSNYSHGSVKLDQEIFQKGEERD
jgi:hypothetical protein